MRFNLAMLAVFSLCSCSSLSRTVFNQIHEGDSSAHVRDVLGSPDSFEPSVRIAGATAWYYASRGEQCGFTIADALVKAIGCEQVGGYVNPASAMLSGMGNSLRNPSAPPITCTTVGNTATCR